MKYILSVTRFGSPVRVTLRRASEPPPDYLRHILYHIARLNIYRHPEDFDVSRFASWPGSLEAATYVGPAWGQDETFDV